MLNKIFRISAITIILSAGTYALSTMPSDFLVGLTFFTISFGISGPLWLLVGLISNTIEHTLIGTFFCLLAGILGTLVSGAFMWTGICLVGLILLIGALIAKE